jgi:cell division protein FtsN
VDGSPQASQAASSTDGKKGVSSLVVGIVLAALCMAIVFLVVIAVYFARMKQETVALPSFRYSHDNIQPAPTPEQDKSYSNPLYMDVTAPSSARSPVAPAAWTRRPGTVNPEYDTAENYGMDSRTNFAAQHEEDGYMDVKA